MKKLIQFNCIPRIGVWFVLFLYLVNIQLIVAQNEDKVWCIGDSVGIDFNDLGNPKFFKCITTALIDGSRQGYTQPVDNCASISTSKGKLLFYLDFNRSKRIHNAVTDWKYTFGAIRDQQHNILKNGDSLFCEHTFKKGALFLPLSSRKYMLISIGLAYKEDSILATTSKVKKKTSIDLYGNIYYSIIEMDNELNFSVTKKNVLIERGVVGSLSAIKHSNGKDWWLFSRKKNSREILSIKIHEDGVTPETNINLASNLHSDLGSNEFSTDSSGKLLLHVYPSNEDQRILWLDLFSVNRKNGVIDPLMSKKIDKRQEHPTYYFPFTLSPNGNYIYYTKYQNSSDSLFQFTLNENKDAFIDTTLIQGPDSISHIGQFTLCNDGKLYGTEIRRRKITDEGIPKMDFYLSIIDKPNEKGAKCEYKRRIIKLPDTRLFQCVPYFPNYHLGREAGYVDEPEAQSFVIRDTVVCAGTRLVLGLDSLQGYRYRWLADSSIRFGNRLRAIAKPYQNTTYSLLVTHKGITDTATVTIKVKSKLKANFELNSSFDIKDSTYFVAAYQSGDIPEDTIKLRNTSIGGKRYFWDIDLSLGKKYLSSMFEPPYILIQDLIDNGLLKSQWDTITLFTLYAYDADSGCIDTMTKRVKFSRILSRENGRYVQMKMYPNPASDEFTVDFSLSTETIIDLEVFNITGQRMLSQTVQPKSMFSTVDWPEGWYLCKFRVGENSIFTRKLIISK